MKNKKRKSFIQWFLALFALVFVGTVAITNTIVNAYAATVSGITVSGLTATYDNGTWTSSGTNLSGSATGDAGGTCSSASATTSTLTLKNGTGSTAQLSFDYAKPTLGSGGSVTIDGTAVTAAGTKTKELANNGTMTVVIVSGSAGANTSSIEITNIALVPIKEVSVTFVPGANGTLKVNGTTITSQTTITQQSTESFEMVATPASGYKLAGWLKNGALASQTATWTTYFDSNYTIQPTFTASTNAVFQVNTSIFDSLSAAISNAASTNSSKITVVGDGTVSAGNYTIASGKTLLVPYESSYKISTTTPDLATSTGPASPSAFKTLTLASGCNITFNGNLCVNGKLNSNNTSYTAANTGKFGWLKMNSGSSISMQNGSKLYCWGYITGDGTITAESGSNIYEPFQICDLRGGSATNSLNGNSNKVFPVSQYYAQNIGASLTIKYGATETVMSSATVQGSTTNPTIKLVASSGALFTLQSGSTFTKKYDPVEDRVTYDVSGNSSMNSISLNVLITIDSSKYVLPIMENTTIKVHSGTLTINQDLCAIPGSVIVIDSGATLKIASGKNVYIYDREAWHLGHFVYSDTTFKTSYYQPDRANANKFTDADMIDTEVDVNGTVNVEGKIYTTTTNGANIHTSQGTGKIVFATAPTASSTTYQAVQSGTSISYTSISVVSAKLKNGTNPISGNAYTTTAGSSANDNYTYDTVGEEWIKGTEPPTYINIALFDEDGTTSVKYYDRIRAGNTFTFPAVSETTVGDQTNFKFWVDENNDVYTAGQSMTVTGISGETKAYRAFCGGWLGNKYYPYGTGNNNYVTGFYTIGTNTIRDSKTLNVSEFPEGYQIPLGSVCYFASDGELDTNGTTIGTLFSLYRIITNVSNGNIYLVKYGVVQEDYGCFEFIDGYKYYFDEDGKAYVSGTYYLDHNLNDLITPGYYEFDEYGRMIIIEIGDPDHLNGDIVEDSHNQTVKGYGLFHLTIDGYTHLYYCKEDGTIVKNCTFYVKKTNDYFINGISSSAILIEEGVYYFDNNGYMWYGNNLLDGTSAEFGVIVSGNGVIIGRNN